jgi:acyl-CoA hydrolase
LKTKTINDTKAFLSDVMLPSQANPNGNVHGGEIMKMMDNCGSVAAMKHAKKTVVTVRVDELVFYKPIFVGQLVICEANLVFVGKSSMEVKVTVKVEDVMKYTPTEIALTAFFTFVALDEKSKPCEVPSLEILSEEEQALFDLGKKRYLAHKEKGKIDEKSN